MKYKKALLNKLAEKKAKIAVIGMGYVGVPLALTAIDAGYQVLGIDSSDKRVKELEKGKSPTKDVHPNVILKAIERKQLIVSTDYSLLIKADVIIMCVPTPVDQYQQPNTTMIEQATNSIAHYLKNEALIILESTTYPGTTEELICPSLEKAGWRVGETMFVAYSPERVDPGNSYFKTATIPKVIGGVTQNCQQVAIAFYQSILTSQLYPVSSPAVAEMEKLLENTFRNVNIALVNEFALLCHEMNLDIWEVIDAAATKPYGYMPFYPGPGLGGHCIPVDPLYISWKAREFNFSTDLINLATSINDKMPQVVVQRMMEKLNEFAKPIKGSKILLIGVAYKKEVEDYRESPTLPILKKLENLGAECHIVDPYIPVFSFEGKSYETVALTKERVQKSDLVVILTNHEIFDYSLIDQQALAIFDTRNVKYAFTNHHYERL